MDMVHHNTVKSSVRVTVVMLLLSCCFIIIATSSTGDNGNTPKLSKHVEEAKGTDQTQRMPIIDVVKSLYSLSPSCGYWLIKIRSFLHQRWCYYFPPPNLDFRRASGEDEGGTTTKEKVKDAVTKSLDTSKSAVEDSAKTAAKLAEEAVDKTVHKLKRTLSGSGNDVAADLNTQD